MPRILHIGKFFPPFAGGIENFLADLMPAQVEQGDIVAALVHDHQPRLSRFLAPVKAEEFIAPPQGMRLPLPMGGGRGEGLKEISIYRAPCYGRLLYAPVSPQFPFWFNRVLQTFQPQILHLHLPNTSAFFALWLPRARRIPWIIHWHADVVSALHTKLSIAYHAYKPFEQRLLANAHTIIATSEPYQASSTALQPWQHKCRVIPLGIASERLPEPTLKAKNWAEQLWDIAFPDLVKDNHPLTPSLSRRGTPLLNKEGLGEVVLHPIGKHYIINEQLSTINEQLPRNIRILTVGRLTYYKGHEVLIRAMAQVEGAQVFIVGTGELAQRLEMLIRELNLANKVKLLGYCSDVELRGLFATCDCFCLPSLERTEAFGVVLLEAMRYGKPIVASAIEGSGVPWVIKNAGLLVPPQDISALVYALQKMVDNPQLRTDLGTVGQQRFNQVFDIKSVAEQISELYGALSNL